MPSQDDQRSDDRDGRDGRGDWNGRNNDWWDRDDRDKDRGDGNDRDRGDWDDRWDRDWNGRWRPNFGWWYGYPGGWCDYPGRWWRRFPGPPPRASRGSLGVYLRDLPGGLLITSVARGGPADDAGLRSDDMILAIDGRRLNTTREAQRLLFRKAPGDRVRVIYERNGRVRRTAARLAPFRAAH